MSNGEYVTEEGVDVKDILSEIAESFGSVYLYVENGKIAA